MAIVGSAAIVLLLESGVVLAASGIMIVLGSRQLVSALFVVVVTTELLATLPAPTLSTAVAGLELPRSL